MGIMQLHMMTWSNGSIFRVTGPLCGELTGHRWIPPHEGQWREALKFSLTCASINAVTLIVRSLWWCLLLFITMQSSGMTISFEWRISFQCMLHYDTGRSRNLLFSRCLWYRTLYPPSPTVLLCSRLPHWGMPGLGSNEKLRLIILPLTIFRVLQ